MKALRIYYDTTGKIIYNIGLEGTGSFPRTVEEELGKLPPGIQLLEVSDSALINDFQTHKDNSIVNGQLVLGVPAPQPPAPSIPRNALNELDALKQKLKDKGILRAGDL